MHKPIRDMTTHTQMSLNKNNYLPNILLVLHVLPYSASPPRIELYKTPEDLAPRHYQQILRVKVELQWIRLFLRVHPTSEEFEGHGNTLNSS